MPMKIIFPILYPCDIIFSITSEEEVKGLFKNYFTSIADKYFLALRNELGKRENNKFILPGPIINIIFSYITEIK